MKEHIPSRSERVRVNCVAKLGTPHPVTRPPGQVADHGAGGLWKRPAQPDELALSHVFLAATDSRYDSGEALAPSGVQIILSRRSRLPDLARRSCRSRAYLC
jgi:hypothetical protein